MAETELSPLDQLLLAATASYEAEKELAAIPKSKEVSDANEDAFFLSKIASHDLRVLETPSTSDINITKIKKSVCDKSTVDKTKVVKKSSLSTIHTGDTDSSDDECNRNLENNKYNSYGRDIKHLMPEAKLKSEFTDKSLSWKQKRDVPAAVAKEDVMTDPFFGIRISKPLISSAALQDRMSGRAAITMARVKNFIATVPQGQDWVIAGAIVQKSVVRTSQNGSQYIIWTLSDLQNDLKSVSLFLFKSAFKELWKTAVGIVVGVLNPSILENREGSKHQATLSVDNHQKVMIFGHSKDFGFCKAKKKDGDSCTSFVNVNRCTYCLYHVKQEYQKCAGRSELQSKFSGGGLTALRNKVLGKNEVFYAGKSYMAIPAKRNKKLVEKDNKRLTELSKSGMVTLSGCSSNVPKQKRGSATSLEVSRAQRLKDLQLIRKLNGSSDVLSGLESKTNFDSKSVSSEITLDESRQAALDVIAKLKAKTGSSNNTSSSSTAKEETSPKNGNNTPKLSSPDDISVDKSKTNMVLGKTNGLVPKLSDPSMKLCFNEPSTSTTSTKDIDSGKENTTADVLTQKITSKKKNPPNSVEKSSTAKTDTQDCNLNGTSSVTDNTESKTTLGNYDISSVVDVTKLKMFKSFNMTAKPTLSSFGNSTIDLSAPLSKTKADHAKLTALKYVQQNGPIKKPEEKKKKAGVKRFLETVENPEPKKTKLEESLKFSDRFKKIMALTSKHADLLEQHDLEQQEKYFNKLEMREQMEEKMMSTFKVECKAVKCLNCKYTNFSAAERCKEEKHVLKVFNAVKRFFKCGNCGNRTVSLEVCPLTSCKNCGGSKWERTAMMKEKIVTVGQTLSIRGGEQTFINSVETNSNINLLVPDN